MGKKLGIILIILFVMAGLFTGCASTPRTPTKNVFFEQDSDGWVKYYSNDKSRYGFQQRKAINNPSADSNVYEMDVKKTGGYENMSFGMMFGAVDENNGYLVLISVNGNLRIRKIANGKVDGSIQEYTNFPHVNKGYDVINNLKAVKNGNNYDIYLNGTSVYTLTDTSIKGNKIGYFLLIGGSGYDKFPDNPVEAYFKVK